MLGIWLHDVERKYGEEKGNGNSFVLMHVLGMKYDFYVSYLMWSSHEIDFTISILQMRI